jgi:Family of unknown function (DUF6520)
MKKLILVAAVFVFAIGSAFTTKSVFNPTGWSKDSGGNVISGITNDPNCALNGGDTNCSIPNQALSACYDTQTDIQVAHKELKFNF